MRGSWATSALVVVALASCGSSDGDAARQRAPVDRFDGARALELVRFQLRYGYRPAGSPQLRRLAEQLRRRLPRGRLEPVAGHPGLRNVVGSIPGRGRPIVLAAHYDTNLTPRGYLGANDSASGTAVLIEVARALARIDRPARAPAIRFVLFDGEEEPGPTDDFYRDALRGSKDYVRRHRAEVRAVVLLDYVGNRGLRLPREATSDRDLWSRVRRAAARVGAGRHFPDATGAAVIDDHTPFLRAGIPAVDLIDFSYPHAHTSADTIDKLSVDSLDAVGETVTELLRDRL